MNTEKPKCDIKWNGPWGLVSIGRQFFIISHILFVLGAEAVTALVLDYLSLNTLSRVFVQQPLLEESNSVSLHSKGKTYLRPMVKYLVSLNTELPYNIIHSICRCYLVLFLLPFGEWCLAKKQQNDDTLDTRIAMSNKLNLVWSESVLSLTSMLETVTS